MHFCTTLSVLPAGTVTALVKLFTDDFVFHFRGPHPMAGDHAGVGGLLGVIGSLFEATGGDIELDQQFCFGADGWAAEWEHVKPGDADRLFYKMAWWKKVIVMAGGPTVNLLIAFFLFWTVFGTYGARTIEPNPGPPVIETVSECLLPYAEEGRACRPDDPPSPAIEAGLLPGDVIISFNGVEVTGWEQFRGLIRDNAGGQAVIGYERDGQPMTGTTNTTVQARPTSNTDGNPSAPSSRAR